MQTVVAGDTDVALQTLTEMLREGMPSTAARPSKKGSGAGRGIETK
jgi:hypothetical protein